MSFTLLNFLFKIGRIFGATPASTRLEKEGDRRKLYVLLILLLLTLSLAASLTDETDVNILVVCRLLLNLLLYAVHFQFAIVLNLWKRRSWNDLLKSLKHGGCLTTTNRLPHYFGFVSFLLLHMILTGCIYFFNNEQRDFDVYTRIPTIILQTMHFFYCFLLYVITNMILSRYKFLTTLLKSFFKHRPPSCGNLPLKFFHKIEYTLRLLQKSVEVYNDMFGPVLFCSFSYTIVTVYRLICSFYYSSKPMPTTHIVIQIVSVFGSVFASFSHLW
jgi:hypothetical protein